MLRNGAVSRQTRCNLRRKRALWRLWLRFGAYRNLTCRTLPHFLPESAANCSTSPSPEHGIRLAQLLRYVFEKLHNLGDSDPDDLLPWSTSLSEACRASGKHSYTT